jgi:membrane protease YdiL (CAAX protease family)
MYDHNSKGISYTAGFFILIAFAITGFILYSAISVPLWTSMTGKSWQEMEKGLKDPAYSNVGKILQSISAILGFLIPAIATAALLNRKPFQLLGFSSRITPRQIGLVLVIIAVALFVAGALSYVNYQIPIPASWKARFDKMETEYDQQAQAILSLKNIWDYLLALVVMGFLPALCEETLFRGGLQNFLYRSTGSFWLSVITISIIFSAVHISFYGFLFRFLLGFVLGWIYHYSGKLWLNIFAHFINNALVITIYYIYVRQGKAMTEVADNTASSYWGLLAIPALIILLLIFKRLFFNTKPQAGM